mgnify:CR=1 FL=1
MTTSNYVNLIDSQFISISGDDRKDFLQGLITNDINKCNSNTPIYSCFLSPQGKFIADFFVADREKNYLIEIHKKFISDFLDKLRIYKLRSKITINDNEDFKSLVILENNNFLQSNNDIINFIDPRNDKLGKKVYIKFDRINDFKNKFNFKELKFESYRELLIKNLIPFPPDDLIINKSLILENNFEKINAIDWDKGCYVGQEITARMKYRALLKKSIRAVEIISGRTMPGNKIFYNTNIIGEIISCINNLGIAMLKIEDANNAFKNNKVLKTDSASLKIIH